MPEQPEYLEPTVTVHDSTAVYVGGGASYALEPVTPTEFLGRARPRCRRCGQPETHYFHGPGPAEHGFEPGHDRAGGDPSEPLDLEPIRAEKLRTELARRDQQITAVRALAAEWRRNWAAYDDQITDPTDDEELRAAHRSQKVCAEQLLAALDGTHPDYNESWRPE